MASLFLFLAWALFTYFSYQRILNGVLGIIVFMPAYLWRFEIFGWPSTFLELMIVTLFFVWLIKNKNYKNINLYFKKTNDHPLSLFWRWLLALWLLVSVVALFVNFDESSLGLWRAYFLEPMIFFLVFIYSVKNNNDLKKILWALSFLVLWLAILALYQNFSNWNFIAAYNFPHVKRLTSIFPYPNALSLLTAPISALLIGYGLVNIRLKNHYLYFIVGLIGVVLSYLALSQGALLALLISGIFGLILAKKTRKTSLIIISLFIIIGFLMTPLRVKLAVWQQEIFRPELNLQASSLEIRSSQWQETWAMLMDRPIFGAGLSAYQKVVAPYHQYEWLEIYLYPHNIFLNFWSELGIFGLIIFLFIMMHLIYILRKLFLARNVYALPLIATWLVWFVHGLVDVPYFKNDLSVLFFLILGLTIVIGNIDKEKNFNFYLH